MRDALNTADILNWEGQVARLQHERCTHSLTWGPRVGRRNVGRQRTQWVDMFEKTARAQWTRRERYPEERKNFEKIIFKI